MGNNNNVLNCLVAVSYNRQMDRYVGRSIDRCLGRSIDRWVLVITISEDTQSGTQYDLKYNGINYIKSK